MAQEKMFTEVDPNLPIEAQKLIEFGREVMLDDDANDPMMKLLTDAHDLSDAAAMVVYKLIEQAEGQLGDVDDEIVYGSEGVADYLMDVVFAMAQQEGIEGSDDPEVYSAALDKVAEFAQGGGEPMLDEQEPEQPQQPPLMMRQ